MASENVRGDPSGGGVPPVPESRVMGVLALQGAFLEHVKMLRSLGIEAREIRLPDELRGLSGLIIPGGESTAMALLAREYGLVGPLQAFGREHAIWGTCAGAILLSRGSRDEKGLDPPLRLGLMDMVIQRNALGRQVESFRVDLRVPALDTLGRGEAPFPSVFIRAPIIQEVNPERVEVLASLEDGRVVAARQGQHLATSFHPELTGDDRFHRYFLALSRT